MSEQRVPIYSDDAEKRRIYLEGAYNMLQLLSTSPRMNRPQLEIIEEQAQVRREELESLGVKFVKRTLPPPVRRLKRVLPKSAR